MNQISCPACGHAFSSAESPATTPPDPSVLNWFRAGTGWAGTLSTEEAYESYLRAVETAPVSRVRFVADLSFLGVEQVLDDDTWMLIRS